MGGRFEKVRTQDDTLHQIQENVSAAVDPLLRHPFVGAVLLGEYTLTTVAKDIPHLLGRTPIGWLALNHNASAVVYQDAANNRAPDRVLRLAASATVTVRVLVF